MFRTDQKTRKGIAELIAVQLVLAVALLLCSPTVTGDNPDVDKIYAIDIPQSNADQALKTLAHQTGVQVLVPFDLVKAIDTRPISGNYSVMTALAVLLYNTGLSGILTDSGVITISQNGSASRINQNGKGKSMNITNSTKRKTLLAGLVGVFAAGGMTQAAAQGAEAATGQSAIDEIIVTANKREQSLQDVAMSISALSGETIDKRGLVGMNDYLSTLPGVSMQDRGASQNSIIIRGVAAANPQGADASTTGIYFGETPLTDLGSNNAADASGSVDMKLVDIERIEVLRGPQGTLYGSGSMGGTVRTIPNAPDLTQVDGRLATRYSQTANNGSSNNMVQGVLNVPLISDELAVRAVAYHFDNSGYIKNIAASNTNLPILNDGIALGGQANDRDDIGAEKYKGFRVTALWQATDQLAISLAYSQQKIEQNGFPEVNLGLPGDFEQIRLDVGPQGDSRGEFMESEVDLTNLVIDYDLGWGSILSSSSWINYNVDNAIDASPVFLAPLFIPASDQTDAFMEELRFSSKFTGPFQILAGIYYEDRESDGTQGFTWSGNPADDFGIDTDFFIYEATTQKAFFAEMSYQLSEQWEATFGVRHFDYDLERRDSGIGALAEPATQSTLDDKGENFKVNLTYTPKDDTLIYGQWAEGFRQGKPNFAPSNCFQSGTNILNDLGIEAQDGVNSDSLENFEIGLKTSMLDGSMILNAAVYRINWEGIPVALLETSCSQFFTFNAGESKSEGVELALQTKISSNLTLDISASYGEATLTEDAPNLGSKGDNLPGSADVNASVGLEHKFTLAGMDAFFRGDYIYIGEYFHNLAETGQASGGYGTTNLKLGVTIDAIDVDLYVYNLSNADDFTWLETVYPDFGIDRAYRLRPRTIGLNIGYNF